MKWHQLMNQLKDVVLADPVLSSIYGTSMRMAGVGDVQAPLLEWMLIADSENELWAPTVIQFDQWTGDMPTLARSEQRLRRLFHLDLPATFGTITCWAQYVDGESLAAPDRDGYYARAIRFRFTPLRDRYAPAPTP